MLRAVQSNRTTAARRRRRIALRGVSRRMPWCAAVGERAAQRHDHGRPGRRRADRRRAVRLAGSGPRRSTSPASSARTWAAAAASRRCATQRHGVAADAGAQVNFQDWRTLDATTSSSASSPRTRADNFTAKFQLFDVLRGESLTGFRLQTARAPICATRRTASPT